MIQRLDRVVPEPPVAPPALPFTERMQGITREIAQSLESWTPTRKDEMTRLFDQLSTDWRSGADVVQDDALEDALERGGVVGRGIALDIGSGTGVFTASLARRFEFLVSVDLSLEMLRCASAGASRVCADGADLPFPDGAVTTVVIANCFLFPAEVARVLSSDGELLWVSVFGDKTPIYLSVEEIARVLPGAWNAVTADAGMGSWAIFRRAH